MDLYQVCSYNAPGVKTGPSTGVTIWNIGTNKEKFFSETGRPRALIFSV